MCTKVKDLRQEAERLAKIEARDQRKATILASECFGLLKTMLLILDHKGD
jgi:hypothetical protein